MRENDVPTEYRNQWLEVSEELSVAAMELNRATLRYQAAITARLALREMMGQDNG